MLTSSSHPYLNSRDSYKRAYVEPTASVDHLTGVSSIERNHSTALSFDLHVHFTGTIDSHFVQFLSSTGISLLEDREKQILSSGRKASDALRQIREQKKQWENLLNEFVDKTSSQQPNNSLTRFNTLCGLVRSITALQRKSQDERETFLIESLCNYNAFLYTNNFTKNHPVYVEFSLAANQLSKWSDILGKCQRLLKARRFHMTFLAAFKRKSPLDEIYLDSSLEEYQTLYESGEIFQKEKYIQELEKFCNCYRNSSNLQELVVGLDLMGDESISPAIPFIWEEFLTFCRNPLGEDRSSRRLHIRIHCGEYIPRLTVPAPYPLADLANRKMFLSVYSLFLFLQRLPQSPLKVRVGHGYFIPDWIEYMIRTSIEPLLRIFFRVAEKFHAETQQSRPFQQVIRDEILRLFCRPNLFYEFCPLTVSSLHSTSLFQLRDYFALFENYLVAGSDDPGFFHRERSEIGDPLTRIGDFLHPQYTQLLVLMESHSVAASFHPTPLISNFPESLLNQGSQNPEATAELRVPNSQLFFRRSGLFLSILLCFIALIILHNWENPNF